MSALIDLEGAEIDEDLVIPMPHSPSPAASGPKSHLNSVEALQANLKVIRHFFAKQIVMSDQKMITKQRIIAIYPYGLKFVTEPPEDQFEPEHIAQLFSDAFLFKFVEISKFRYDPAKSEFAFVHVSPATSTQHSTTTEFLFRTFSVLELKDLITQILQRLQARVQRLQNKKQAGASVDAVLNS